MTSLCTLKCVVNLRTSCEVCRRRRRRREGCRISTPKSALQWISSGVCVCPAEARGTSSLLPSETWRGILLDHRNLQGSVKTVSGGRRCWRTGHLWIRVCVFRGTASSSASGIRFLSDDAADLRRRPRVPVQVPGSPQGFFTKTFFIQSFLRHQKRPLNCRHGVRQLPVPSPL